MNDFTKRQDHEVTVFYGSPGDSQTKMPPENLLEFIVWLDTQLKLIPDEYRNKAKIEIDTDDIGYHESYNVTTVKISYRRPETDQEMKNRVNVEMQFWAEKEAQELALLQKLQAKYHVKS